jgi:hypothetical protein
METSSGDSDGCTFWFNGDWAACCWAHDSAYDNDAVTIWSHIDLGICVAQTSGGFLMGLLMAVATTLWWLIKHRGSKNPYSRR